MFWENIVLVAGTARQKQGTGGFPPPLTSPWPIGSQEKSIIGPKVLSHSTLKPFHQNFPNSPKFPRNPRNIVFSFQSDFRFEFGEIVAQKYRAFVPKALKIRFRKDSARFSGRIEPRKSAFITAGIFPFSGEFLVFRQITVCFRVIE